jgi:ANTAR domain/GAF domain
VELIPGADCSGVSLNRGGEIRTVGSTDEIVQAVDRVQLNTGEGPCLSAIRKQSTFLLDDVSTDVTWPHFSAEISGLGIASLLSFVLAVDGSETFGALTLCSSSPRAFTSEDIRVGAIFAAQAGVALANAQAQAEQREFAERLRERTMSREVVGIATGILMEREGCSTEEAHEVLAYVAKDLERRLRDVAQDVVDASEDLRTTERQKGQRIVIDLSEGREERRPGNEPQGR